MFKSSFIISALAAGLAIAAPAVSAATATVSLSGGQEQLIVLNDVTSASLSFSLPQSTSYVNGGGYVKWSTNANGWAG